MRAQKWLSRPDFCELLACMMCIVQGFLVIPVSYQVIYWVTRKDNGKQKHTHTHTPTVVCKYTQVYINIYNKLVYTCTKTQRKPG